MLKTTLSLALISLSALTLSACNVDKTTEGNVIVPEYEIEKKQTGDVTLPEYDVKTAEVETGTEKKTIEVPKVTTEEKTIEVPTVDVKPPKE